ncbi:MAG: thioredoxin TrxC [Betaproteobacteria bacterium]|nr:MAG: thioredoxin TrxC [Betaproteobacteria bacterium]
MAQPAALVLVACPACLTGNRVPRERLGEAPKCGQCGAGLLDGKPVALDDSNFDSVVGRTELPVVVDFWAPWCAPCRAMAPAFEQLAGEFATRVRFAKLNTDASQAVAARFGIRSIPTLVLLHGGREMARKSGALDARALRQWLEPRA